MQYLEKKFWPFVSVIVSLKLKLISMSFRSSRRFDGIQIIRAAARQICRVSVSDKQLSKLLNKVIGFLIKV